MTCRQARTILGVSKSATVAEVRTRFYKRAKATHPDASGNPDATDFLLARAAFGTLLRCLSGVQRDEAETELHDTDATFEAREWTTLEGALKAAFTKLRDAWSRKPVLQGLIPRLNEKVDSYSSVMELRNSLRGDIPKVVTAYLLQVNRELQNDVRSVASVFNRQITDMYFPLFERVRQVRLSHLVRDRAFIWSVLSSSAVLTIAAALWPQAPAGVPLAAILGGIPLGYVISRTIVGRPPGQISYLEVPAIRELVTNLQAPNSLAKEDLIKGGFLLVLADWLDFDLGFEWLEWAGLVLVGLSMLIGKSLDRVKADTKVEIAKKVQQAIDLRSEIEKLFDLYWDRLLSDAKDSHVQNRRVALQQAKAYGGLLEIGRVSEEVRHAV